jgi:serine/threonine protein kinase
MSVFAKDFVSKFLGLDRKRIEKLLHQYKQGSLTCLRCKSVMDFSNCVPLSLTKCPSCGDVIFVPHEIEKWWVMEPVGAGGFGSVFLARSSENPDIKAAVKVLQRSEHIDQETVDKFVSEAEIAYSFQSHPHLMETYAIGRLEDGNPFMIMEYVEGDRLTDHISNRGRIPTEECLYYTLDMLSALEFIYKAGYLYRDMKPDNIIIKDNGLATIIDYGLCVKIEDAKDKGKGRSWMVGSALFVPPERCFGRPEDYRGDIYSLGMVLYYALMGDSFFSRTEIRTAVRAHTMKVRIQTQSRMAGCDPFLIDLVDKMIRRDPEERFQSYDEVRQAIFSILAGYQQQKTKDPVILRRRRHFLDAYGELKYE